MSLLETIHGCGKYFANTMTVCNAPHSRKCHKNIPQIAEIVQHSIVRKLMAARCILSRRATDRESESERERKRKIHSTPCLGIVVVLGRVPSPVETLLLRLLLLLLDVLWPENVRLSYKNRFFDSRLLRMAFSAAAQPHSRTNPNSLRVRKSERSR